jgi:hypothetical protein
MDNRNTLSPELKIVLQLRVDIGPSLELGTSISGLRRTIPITGGTFAGRHTSGRVLPGGADWQFIEPDALTRLEEFLPVTFQGCVYG